MNVTFEMLDSGCINSPINVIIRNGVNDVNNSIRRQPSGARNTKKGLVMDAEFADLWCDGSYCLNILFG